jgi:cell division septal protein FtsQ
MKSQKNRRTKRRQQKKRLTPIFFVLGGALLVALAVWAFLGKGTAPKAAIEVTGSPSLKVDQEQIDLGDVTLGKTVSVAFQVTNVGDQPLRFQKQPYVEVVEGC